MKKFFLMVALTATITSAATEGIAGTSLGFYKRLTKRNRIGQVRVYDAEDLTARMLETRYDDVIIERVYGVVTNKKKDGRQLNAPKGHDYISYRSVKGAKKGDIIMTLLVYAPTSKKYDEGNVDDIVDRFDYIIDRKGR